MGIGHKFDHERARELYAAGEMTLQQIANELGVARTSVRRVVEPEYKEREKIWNKTYLQKKRRNPRRENNIETHSRAIQGFTFIPVSISMNKEQARMLDQEAARRETTRAAIVREAIALWLKENHVQPKSRGWRNHDGATGETRTTRDARTDPDHPE